MRRREFLAAFTGAAAWPLGGRAQPLTRPTVGFIHPGSPEAAARYLAAFRNSLNGSRLRRRPKSDSRVPLVGGPVRWSGSAGGRSGPTAGYPDSHARAAGAKIALAVKAATATIPIVFGVPMIRFGLVLSPASTDLVGNVTGINYFQTEVSAKAAAASA